MAISTIRRLAADIFGVGENKIRISPDGMKEAEGALTRSDVKGLIEKGIIKKLKPSGRASTRKRDRKGPGHRHGKSVRLKDVWMEKVRSQRKFLKMLITTGAVGKDSKRSLYGKVKSGIFRNKRAMLLYLKDNRLVAADYEPPKPEFRKKETPQKKEMPKEAKGEKQKGKDAGAPASAPLPHKGEAAVQASKPRQVTPISHESKKGEQK